MADRVELLNAMRVISEHCLDTKCENCPLQDDWCGKALEPWEWDLEDGEANEG